MSLCVQNAWRRSLISNHGGVRPSAALRRRNPSTAAKDEKLNVAILGGGITGLSAAIDLLSTGKPCKITILESQPRLGGWITSDFVDVPGGKVLFEKGCRTLRPVGAAGLAGLSMVHKLGLEKELLTCSKQSPAAKNRYVYYPDRLVRMPGSLAALPSFLLREPLGKGIIAGVFRDLFRPYKSAAKGEDASVAEVFSKRLHPKMVNLVSAVLHGIYAGSVQKLGFNALFPQLDYYIKQHGGLVRGALYNMRQGLRGKAVIPLQDKLTIEQIVQGWEAGQAKRAEVADMSERVAILGNAKKSSVYSFKQGIQQMPDRMRDVLRESPDVKIETDCLVASIRTDESGRSGLLVKIGGKGEPERHFTHVISTIASKNLRDILRTDALESDVAARDIDDILGSNRTVNVMVVNLWFAEPNLLSVNGFGHLIPREMPAEQNPERGLGVIYDSDAIQGTDTAKGTKLTVMLGGHYWDDLAEKDLPSAETGLASARALLARHLGITAEPVATCATMRKNCIAQYTPGHPGRMRKLRSLLQDKYNDRLVLAGSSYDGVGVNDCIRSAMFASQSVRLNQETGRGPGGLLRSYTNSDDPSTFVSVPKKYLQWTFS